MTPQPFSMCQRPSKPTAKKVLLLGEAPGEEEEKHGKPFIGAAGQVLNALLQIAGFDREELWLTNVFAARPPGNDLKLWTLTKTELKKAGISEVGRAPPLNKRYLHPEREPELARLRAELAEIKPDLIIALGGTALWALSGDGRITQNRGNLFTTDWGWAIATFHPASVLRQWDQRPLVWADLIKSRRHLNGTLPAPLKRKLYINPTFAEMKEVHDAFLSAPTRVLGVDIETAPGADQITTIAFGWPERGICIPLWNKQTVHSMSNCYGTASEEALAWRWIERFCDLPNPKVLQNGLYDMQYLLDVLDIRPRNVLHDTAILQHALQPELPKALGTLASLYLNEPSWKFMRESTKDDNKADE